MLNVSKPSANRLNIELSGALDTEENHFRSIAVDLVLCFFVPKQRRWNDRSRHAVIPVFGVAIR